MKTIQVSVTIPKELHTQIIQQAIIKKRSISGYIRVLLEEHFNSPHEENSKNKPRN